jgi:hypothetical protein
LWIATEFRHCVVSLQPLTDTSLFCNYLFQFKNPFSLISCQSAVTLAVLLYVVATQFSVSIVRDGILWRACSTYGGRRGASGILVERPDGKNHLEDLGIDGMIMLKCIFKKRNWEAWTGLIWLRIGTVGVNL